ncbi:glycosyltransferase [Oceanicella actignis]|uniref:glycosyltransferase n=1 Tax=Oceanicella actignis TaxID=1189325 RepID=UPI0011E88DD4|nr:glycosyltransferase [Oceanicella actignis]TYO88785.1 glycosyltransferase involved in cell wall biosynthesis [Oceanicella actignis]
MSARAGAAPLPAAVVTTEIGIPSEIWIARQIREMPGLAATLIAWRRNAAPVWGQDIPARLIDAPFAPPRSLLRRAAGRLGDPRALAPTRDAARAIRDAIAQVRPRVILCHFAWNAIPLAAALRDWPEAPPLVLMVHGRDVSALARRKAYRRAVGQALRQCARAVAVGRFQVDLLHAMAREAGVAPPPCAVIPCGAPVALFSAAPAPLRAPGQGARFISVGRLSAEKGVMETLRAFEIVHAAAPDSEWICVGDGPLRARLEAALAASPARAAVRLTGRRSAEEVARLLAGAHVFVQHSTPAGGSIEGFGVSLTEAGAAGLPLVASRLGGIPDQLEHGRNGFLFAPGDVAAQAEAMLTLARDEALRRKMGEAAREVAARFDSRLMSARMERLLREAAGA